MHWTKIHKYLFERKQHLLTSCGRGISDHMHTQAVCQVQKGLDTVKSAGTKIEANNSNLCLETHLCFALFTVYRLCYRVTMAVFSICIKAHCSASSAFRLHFPWWHERLQHQFVTARVDGTRVCVCTLVQQTYSTHFELILLIVC